MRQYNMTKTNRITNLHCRVSGNNDHTRNSRNSFWQHQSINICSHDAIFFSGCNDYNFIINICDLSVKLSFSLDLDPFVMLLLNQLTRLDLKKDP